MTTIAILAAVLFVSAAVAIWWTDRQECRIHRATLRRINAHFDRLLKK